MRLEGRLRVLGLDDFWFKVVLALSGSIGVAWSVAKVARITRVKCLEPGTSVLIRILGSNHRSTFISATSDGWLLSAPDPLEYHRPFRIGDPIVLEVKAQKGVQLFRATILGCGVFDMLISRPAIARIQERRELPRLAKVGHVDARMDGNRVALIDLSRRGARLRAQSNRDKGQRVKLEMEGCTEPVYGWVLASANGAKGFDLRVRFEDDAELGSLTGAA